MKSAGHQVSCRVRSSDSFHKFIFKVVSRYIIWLKSVIKCCWRAGTPAADHESVLCVLRSAGDSLFSSFPSAGCWSFFNVCLLSFSSSSVVLITSAGCCSGGSVSPQGSIKFHLFSEGWWISGSILRYFLTPQFCCCSYWYLLLFMLNVSSSLSKSFRHPPLFCFLLYSIKVEWRTVKDFVQSCRTKFCLILTRTLHWDRRGEEGGASPENTLINFLANKIKFPRKLSLNLLVRPENRL